MLQYNIKFSIITKFSPGQMGAHHQHLKRSLYQEMALIQISLSDDRLNLIQHINAHAHNFYSNGDSFMFSKGRGGNNDR